MSSKPSAPKLAAVYSRVSLQQVCRNRPARETKARRGQVNNDGCDSDPEDRAQDYTINGRLSRAKIGHQRWHREGPRHKDNGGKPASASSSDSQGQAEHDG